MSAHPFLTGSVKPLFIDGEHRLSHSGESFDCIDPSTGQVLTRVVWMNIAGE
jgi:aldehyde dehydrogenase (NAD+)